MTVFEKAWAMLKMPVYHGTTEDAWEKIQQDGFLMPTERPPDIEYGNYQGKEKELQEILGMSDEEFETNFGGDWSFFWGDSAKPGMQTVGGKAGAITLGANWVDGVDSPVVLEIDDSQPHSPVFMPEIPIEGIAWDEQYDQRRTNQPIPIDLIRRLSQSEIEEAQAKEEMFFDAERERDRLMAEAYRSQAMLNAPDDDFYSFVDMRDKRNTWKRNPKKRYWRDGR
jgi:hypothetical protein